MSTDVAPPLRVLFVCTANIARSPYMELLARTRVGSAGPVFSSAGVEGRDGHAMDPVMAAELAQRGVDAAPFRSRRLTSRMVAEADLVLTAEARHRGVILDEVPAAIRTVFTFGQADAALARLEEQVLPLDLPGALARARGGAPEDLDVPDPYRRGPDAARRCAVLIDGLVDRLLARFRVSA